MIAGLPWLILTLDTSTVFSDPLPGYFSLLLYLFFHAFLIYDAAFVADFDESTQYCHAAVLLPGIWPIAGLLLGVLDDSALSLVLEFLTAPFLIVLFVMYAVTIIGSAGSLFHFYSIVLLKSTLQKKGFGTVSFMDSLIIYHRAKAHSFLIPRIEDTETLPDYTEDDPLSLARLALILGEAELDQEVLDKARKLKPKA